MKKTNASFNIELKVKCPYCDETMVMKLDDWINNPRLIKEWAKNNTSPDDMRDTLMRGIVRVIYYGENTISEIPILCKNKYCDKIFILIELNEEEILDK